MKHLAIIQKQFSILCISNSIVKKAIDENWWKKLSPEEQRKYLMQHRRTKLRPTSQPFNLTQTIFRSVPASWKKTISYAGGGNNSDIEQLPDMLRSKVLKDAFSAGAKAVVGFKSGTNITKMKPVFIITSSTWSRSPKFNIETAIDSNGNTINPVRLYDIKPRYSRRNRVSWDERVTDLRMTNIIGKLPDEPYTVYAIKADPKRQEIKQQRSFMKEKNRPGRVDVENRMIADVVKPVYDYYSAKLQQGLEQLRDVAVPSFNDLLEDTESEMANKRYKMLIDDVKDARDKIASLSSAVSSLKWQHLPTGEHSYSDTWRAGEAKRFIRGINEIKERFADDMKEAKKTKLKAAYQSLQEFDFLDAFDKFNDVAQPQLAKAVLELKSIDRASEEYKNRLNDIKTKALTIMYS